MYGAARTARAEWDACVIVMLTILRCGWESTVSASYSRTKARQRPIIMSHERSVHTNRARLRTLLEAKMINSATPVEDITESGITAVNDVNTDMTPTLSRE